MEYLRRSVERRDSAGPRSSLATGQAEQVTALCSHKLSDSDASVRKAALDAFRELQKGDDPQIESVVANAISSLQTSNPRTYTSLSKSPADAGSGKPVIGDTDRGRQPPVKVAPKKNQSPAKSMKPREPVRKKENEKKKSSSDSSVPSIEAALEFATKLDIPRWDASEDDAGVLAGLQCKYTTRLSRAVLDGYKLIVSFDL